MPFLALALVCFNKLRLSKVSVCDEKSEKVPNSSGSVTKVRFLLRVRSLERGSGFLKLLNHLTGSCVESEQESDAGGGCKAA